MDYYRVGQDIVIKLMWWSGGLFVSIFQMEKYLILLNRVDINQFMTNVSWNVDKNKYIKRCLVLILKTWRVAKEKDVKHQANDGIPVQCPEDRALGALEVKCKVGPDKTQ